MKKMMNRLYKREGFTLAELLIVVAIIAVLVAIAIPVFTSQLEKAREATDAANLRAAYAEQMVQALQWDGTSTIAAKKVASKQTRDGWQGGQPDIGGLKPNAKTGGTEWEVTVTTTGNEPVVAIN